MANYQNKPGQGAIFKNKKTNDKAPDYRGSVNIDGKEWEIAGWSKQTKTGEGYLSISVKEPYNKGAAVEQSNNHTDNLPF